MADIITTIGLDLAKTVFQIRAADSEGKPVLKKRLRRAGCWRSSPVLNRDLWAQGATHTPMHPKQKYGARTVNGHTGLRSSAQISHDVKFHQTMPARFLPALHLQVQCP